MNDDTLENIRKALVETDRGQSGLKPVDLIVSLDLSRGNPMDLEGQKDPKDRIADSPTSVAGHPAMDAEI